MEMMDEMNARCHTKPLHHPAGYRFGRGLREMCLPGIIRVRINIHININITPAVSHCATMMMQSVGEYETSDNQGERVGSSWKRCVVRR